MKNVFVQMYSLGPVGRERTMQENLKSLADIGYAGVEFAGSNYGGMDAAELKAELEKNGLKCRSAHVSMANIVRDLPLLKEIGAEYAIVASHPFSNEEETIACAKLLNENGKEAAKYGMKVGYHNHTQEFNKVGDKYLLEILIENTDPETVIFQIDCGWATAAGINAAEFIQKYSDRVAAIHIKENSVVIGPSPARSPNDPPRFPIGPDGRPVLTDEQRAEQEKSRIERAKWNCPTGQGIVNWNDLKKVTDGIGISLYVVEREASYNDPEDRLQCLKEDYDFLRDNVD